MQTLHWIKISELDTFQEQRTRYLCMEQVIEMSASLDGGIKIRDVSDMITQVLCSKDIAEKAIQEMLHWSQNGPLHDNVFPLSDWVKKKEGRKKDGHF